MNNKPYERPNTFNYNRLQFQSQNANQPKPTFTPGLTNSQNINQNQNSIQNPSNGPFKPRIGFAPNYSNVKRDNPLVKDISLENKNQNYLNKNVNNSETNDKTNYNNSKDNTFLPKSIQKVRELAPLFVRKDFKPNIKDKFEAKK